MKDLLCSAFCSEIAIHPVHAGVAVSTAFCAPDGDRIGFFVRAGTPRGTHRIEDKGLLLATLEASGFSLKSASRRESLQALLREYGVGLDPESGRFFVDGVPPNSVGVVGLRFVAFMLRANDLVLLSEPRVASTFKEDVERLLREAAGDKVRVEYNAPLAEGETDLVPDFVLRASGRAPVGVFLCASEGRLLEAVVLQMRLLHELRRDWPVVALIEREKAISHRVRRQATNRLRAVREFRGDEVAAVQKVIYEAVGASASFH